MYAKGCHFKLFLIYKCIYLNLLLMLNLKILFDLRNIARRMSIIKLNKYTLNFLEHLKPINNK